MCCHYNCLLQSEDYIKTGFYKEEDIQNKGGFRRGHTGVDAGFSKRWGSSPGILGGNLGNGMNDYQSSVLERGGRFSFGDKPTRGQNTLKIITSEKRGSKEELFLCICPCHSRTTHHLTFCQICHIRYQIKINFPKNF